MKLTATVVYGNYMVKEVIEKKDDETLREASYRIYGENAKIISARKSTKEEIVRYEKYANMA